MMVIGVLQVSLHLPMTGSLKEKRGRLQRIKKSLSSSFNVTVAEIGDHELWQRSLLAVVTVGSSRSGVESTLAHLVQFLEKTPWADVLSYETELVL